MYELTRRVPVERYGVRKQPKGRQSQADCRSRSGPQQVDDDDNDDDGHAAGGSGLDAVFQHECLACWHADLPSYPPEADSLVAAEFLII